MSKARKLKSYCNDMCQEWKRYKIKCFECKVRLCKVCAWKLGKHIYCRECALEQEVTLKLIVDALKTQ